MFRLIGVFRLFGAGLRRVWLGALRLVASLPVRRLALPAAIECALASAAPEGVAGGKTIRAGHWRRVVLAENYKYLRHLNLFGPLGSTKHHSMAL